MANLDVRRVIQRGLLTSGLGLVALLLALWVASRTNMGAGALADLRARAQLGPLALATLAMSSAFVFMGLRWRALLPPGFKPPALAMAAMLCAGLLLNYALPGPVGEVGAAWFAHRRYGVPMAESLASGVAARLIGLASAALLAVGVWALVDLPVPEGYSGLVGASALLIGMGGALLAVLAAFPRPWQRLATRLLGLLRRPAALARLAARANQGVVAITEAMARTATRGPIPYARATAWSIAGHLSVSGGIAIAVWSFGTTPNLAGLVFTYTLTTAGAVAMFAFPGSQVTWDVGFVTLLVGTCGLSLPDALAVGATVRIQQVALQGVGAVAISWLVAGSAGLPDRVPTEDADSG